MKLIERKTPLRITADTQVIAGDVLTCRQYHSYRGSCWLIVGHDPDGTPLGYVFTTKTLIEDAQLWLGWEELPDGGQRLSQEFLDGSWGNAGPRYWSVEYHIVSEGAQPPDHESTHDVPRY